MHVHALLFIDLVDSTALTERLGDAAAADMSKRHDRTARDLLVAHRGREIDRTDGFFLLFDDAADAARYALDYRTALRPLGLAARIGLHVGTVTLRENAAADVARGAKPVEVEGLAKPVAARVMGLARSGQALLSAAARTAVGERVPATFRGHGHYRLKGVAEPVEVIELCGVDQAPAEPPPDNGKAFRVVRTGDLWCPVRDVRHTLPAERDGFIGRTSELRALADRLDGGARLISLIGPGGTGKTRLVRRYGWTALGDWPGGIYFCDLSDARSLDGVVSAVAVALAVPLGKVEPAVQLGHVIDGRGRCLVILDNFEQVIEHAGATVARWLDRAADAAFLVTSREHLHLAGETVVPLEPLPLIDEAVDLFALRARARKPDFAIDVHNRASVERIVELLDGLPLAIELAAARIRLLSPAQIVARMQDRFGLLAGVTGGPARQSTLRAAIDWSWDLLAPDERTALAQCSIFEGGFTLDAAEAVLDLSSSGGTTAAIDAIQALVDKSLLRTWTPVDERRHDFDEPWFGMYLSIHEYAAGKLAEDEARRAATEARHWTWFARFGTDDALESLQRAGGSARLLALALDLDNLMAACRRAVARREAAPALANYRAAWGVLERQGPYEPGIGLGSQVLALLEPGPDRAAACLTHGRALLFSGHTDASSRRIEEALDCRTVGVAPHIEAQALVTLGMLRRMEGRMTEARQLVDAAIAGAVDAADLRGIEALALTQRGVLARMHGTIDDARADYLQALAIHRETGNRNGEAAVLGNLGNLHGEIGSFAEARGYLEESLAIARETGDRAHQGLVLGNLGALENDVDCRDAARTRSSEGLAIHRDMGNRREEAFTRANLAATDFCDGDLSGARAHCEAALAIVREVADRRHEGDLIELRGDIHRASGEADRARRCYDEALAIHRAVANRRSEGTALVGLAALDLDASRVDDARARLELAIPRLEEVRHGVALRKALDLRHRALSAVKPTNGSS